MNPTKMLPSERHGIPLNSISSAILDAERHPTTTKHTQRNTQRNTQRKKKRKAKMSTTEKNQYDKQAEKFLTDCGLTFKATRAKTQTTPPWNIPGERSGLRYWITIARAGKGTRGRLSFPFWDSIAAREAGTTPRAYDVLACISGDIFTPETFSEFCAEYDYNEDSRKGFAAFRRCDRFARRLRAFFSEDEQKQLAEIR